MWIVMDFHTLVCGSWRAHCWEARAVDCGVCLEQVHMADGARSGRAALEEKLPMVRPPLANAAVCRAFCVVPYVFAIATLTLVVV